MINEDYIKLCIKDISGNITKSEREKLSDWMNQSVDNKIEYENIKKVWTKISPGNLPELPDIDNEWYNLHEQLNLDGTQTRNKSLFEKFGGKAQFNLPSLLKPLGAVAIVIMLTVIGLNLLNDAGPEHKLVEVTTANAMNKEVILPDGSEVVLNNSSKISYYEPFNENIRQVELEGEAFFSVTKNPEVPFVIKTTNAQVKVLGTQFDVWSREAETKVVVKNGKVELSSQDGKNTGIFLIKDQTSKVVGNAPPLAPEHVDSEFLLGWLDGNLVFDKTLLPKVVDELERHYNISIEITSDKLKNLALTGEFNNEEPDSVLTMICLALDIDYSRENDHFILKNK